MQLTFFADAMAEREGLTSSIASCTSELLSNNV